MGGRAGQGVMAGRNPGRDLVPVVFSILYMAQSRFPCFQGHNSFEELTGREMGGLLAEVWLLALHLILSASTQFKAPFRSLHSAAVSHYLATSSSCLRQLGAHRECKNAQSSPSHQIIHPAHCCHLMSGMWQVIMFCSCQF